ncbi:helix-turn-helix domain-containing protein [Bacillus marasmi]|uniref:helix-turn-helix domain-containing protein n=1 Tax=Bacillus marasmi TaxID=1926279 RepID=UPI0011C8DA10|nr:helix-turn-helix transcriptional regulator [Bacillus marasmi]
MKFTSGKIGELITELRLARDLTQEELAYNTGMSTKGLSNLERNASEPKLKTVMNMACAFDMKPSEFMDEIEKFLIKKGKYNENA